MVAEHAASPAAEPGAIPTAAHPAGLLARVHSPQDVKALSPESLPMLAAEVRDFLVDKVSRTGGHLGPNLGAVELSIALHRVFDSPKDRILFDTGHQSYVHKILTGRQSQFDQLRQRDGLSGYPSQAESPHDVIENSHASTALSYADGLAKAYALRGETDRRVIAVVGDGALTGGMCWEALNNIAGAKDRPVVIVVNDNGRSYSPTIGGLASRLAALRLSPSYERVIKVIRGVLARTPLVGQPLTDALQGIKRGLKDTVMPDALFSDLGIKYLGPVDGHDIRALEEALTQARAFGQPVIVHAVTRKGYGYRPAEDDEADCLHGPPAFDPRTGKPVGSSGTKWTSVFADELVTLAGQRPEIVGITAAMAGPTGIDKLARAFPERAFDVGIAEQHAVTSAAGLAMGGLHPVVAVYSTFLNRAFDQVLLDVALHKLPVTFVLDRAGITGPDGPSHFGIWDMAVFGVVPGLRIAAPRDGARLREELREGLSENAPTLVRFPTGSVPGDIPAVERLGSGFDAVDVISRAYVKDVLLVTPGAFAGLGLQVAGRLREQGIGATVVDPRWVLPVSSTLTELASHYRLVVTVEDGIVTGGFGDAVGRALRDASCHNPLRTLGVPAGFHPHGTRAEILAELGLTPQNVSRQVVEWVLQLNDDSTLAPV